ncbi:MAG: hypothetical protein HY820_01510 [Acidobacteria bacterium]|nr:hypothetical protein [Acidobacteriota bacterium]
MANYRDVMVKLRESSDDESRNHGDRYPYVREALAPEYSGLPSEAIEGILETLYPATDPEDVENFFRTLSRAGRSVGRVAKTALPGMIQGATTGAALGPWGALAGGLAGGAMSIASGAGRRPAGGMGGGRRGGGRGLPNRAGSIQHLASSPAAGQLLQTINRPEVMQALSALAMGGAGRRNINAGGVSVPTGAITTALRHLLEQVEDEMHEWTAGEPGSPMYLMGGDGEFAVDPTDEQARAERVIELLARSEAYEDESESDDEGYEVFRVNLSEEDEWADDSDEADDPRHQARTLYPGVYESTFRQD